MNTPQILQQLGNANQNPMIQQINQMLNSVRMAQNPQLMVQQIINNNPAMRQAMQYVQQHGGDPKAVAEQLYRENGLDIRQPMRGIK